ncbi:MAG TPA: CrcB family protein [Anaeromyxobacter sp.]|nr:CrcB family protein [Anaeromyxobacter sp.]
MTRLLLVCLGGALGTGARYLLATWMAQAFGPGFPRGTILINITGSFLIAVILELSLTTGVISPATRAFLTTGVMGGYTTYSSFNHETIRLAEQGTWSLAALNLGITVLGCLAAGVAGVFAARLLARAGFGAVG